MVLPSFVAASRHSFDLGFGTRVASRPFVSSCGLCRLLVIFMFDYYGCKRLLH
jgi:hypothetical protein